VGPELRKRKSKSEKRPVSKARQVGPTREGRGVGPLVESSHKKPRRRTGRLKKPEKESTILQKRGKQRKSERKNQRLTEKR